jgi:hypothetical protein
MTIPASTVPTAVGYLFDHIVTAVNDTAVLISYGPPGPNQPDDLIVVGAVQRDIAPIQMVGSGQAGWLDERYDVEIVVSVYRGGDASRTVMERACALVDIVVAVVRTDPSLGGVVVVAHPTLVSYDPSFDADHKGRLVDATVTVSCRARI